MSVAFEVDADLALSTTILCERMTRMSWLSLCD